VRYLAVSDLRATVPPDVLARLTDDDPTHSINLKVIDEEKIEAAILWAEAYVDAQLAKRYVVPLDFAAIESDGGRDLVKEATLQMSVYRLYARVEQEQVAKDKRELADRTLGDLSSGKMELSGAEQRARNRILYKAPKARFSANREEGR
jgi:phage gp36-like protein